MARIVPSQVVTLIEALYPRVKSDTEKKPFSIEPTQSPQIAANLDLAAQLPAELIVMPPNQHTEYLCSIAALREVLEKWRANRASLFDRVPGLRSLNPVMLIWQALKECPDGKLCYCGR